MVYTGTLCTEAEIAIFVGELVDATGNTEANHNLLVGHAEAYICLLGKYDFVTNFASLDAVTKKVLAEYCARSAAVPTILFNMAGYTSLSHAEDLLNVNLMRIRKIEDMIKDQTNVNLIKVL